MDAHATTPTRKAKTVRVPKQRPPLTRFFLRLRWLTHKARRILTPRELLKLLLSHNLFFVGDEALVAYGEYTFKEPLRVLLARRPGLPRIVLFVGLQQTHWTAYPAGVLINKVVGNEVVFAQTPPGGNNVSVADMVEYNRWLGPILQEGLFCVYAFSKGGFDALHLIRALGVTHQCLHIFFLSTPFKGSKMAKLINSPGAQEMREGSEMVHATDVLLDEMHAAGVGATLMGAFIDIVSPRSTSRPPNRLGYKPPPWYSLVIPRLRALRHGRWYRPEGEPWYWCITVPQVGHTGLFNLPLALLIGICANLVARRRTEI